MNNLLKTGNFTYVLTLMLMLTTATAMGQGQPSQAPAPTLPDSLKADSTILSAIPPLHTLIDSALANSPLLRRQIKQIYIRQLRTKTINQEWLKYISIFGTTNYGVYDNFMSVTDQNVVGSTINTGNSLRWSVGVALSGTPFYDLINKPTQHRIKELEMQQEIDSKEDLELQIKDAVIQQYNQTILSYNIMLIANKNVQSNFTQLVMSEQMFNHGETSIYSLANVREMYYKSVMTYQKNLYEFRTNYMLLETLCGFKFIKP